jgi:YVTN family beta-propeller protein
VIATASNTVTATIPVGNGPTGAAVTPDGSHVYVANDFSNTVSVIATATNTVTTTIPVGNAPIGVAATPDGSHVYVANDVSNTVSVIATASNTVTAIIPVGKAPLCVAVTPDGSHVYVANLASYTVSVIATASNTVIATVPVGSGPEGVAMTPDGSHVYVANTGSNTVSVIATASNTVTATIPVGNGPVGLAVTPDGSHVYVANFDSNTVSVIATASNTMTAYFADCELEPAGVAVPPDGSHVYVANVLSNTVSVIATASNTVTATVPVGNGPASFGLFIGPAAPALSHSSEPGSIIVYQKFQRGFVAVDVGAPGQSVQPKSLIELAATCPVDDAECAVDQKVVRVNFHWVCPPQPDNAGAQLANPSGGICVENDFFVILTVNGKVWFSPEGGTTSGDLPGQIVPPAPCSRGYLIGFVTNIGKLVGNSTAVFEDSDRPIRFDGLTGDAIMRTSRDLQAFRAITIQADQGTPEERPLTGNGTAGPDSTGVGTLVLDGEKGNYNAATGQLSGDVRYDSDVNPPFADTDLIFLTLDVKSNRLNHPTFVALNFYNAQQQGFSEALSFICWGQINITMTQEGIGSPRGLFITSQALNSQDYPNNNCPDSSSTGCVTLLGAVQVTEGPIPGSANATRSYTVPVFDNSRPIATKYLY